MRTPLYIGNLYAFAAKEYATQAATAVKTYAVDHQSELTCVAATTVVVGLAARVAGFKAGYEFAKSPTA